MPYVQGSEIAKYHAGSFEERIASLQSAIEGDLGKRVTILATHPEHALLIDEDGTFRRADYKIRSGAVSVALSESDVRVLGDGDVPAFIAAELRALVAEALDGRAPDRTRVRDLGAMVRRGEPYWMVDVLEALERTTLEDAAWMADPVQFSESVDPSFGIPVTRYRALPPEKLSAFFEELRDSVGVLSSVYTKVVDEASALVFDGDQERSAVRNSLIVEAQAAASLLSKAEKLMASSDVERTAKAHDRLAERAERMVAVLPWLTPRAPNNEE